jgi:hypothetical protein
MCVIYTFQDDAKRITAEANEQVSVFPMHPSSNNTVNCKIAIELFSCDSAAAAYDIRQII